MQCGDDPPQGVIEQCGADADLLIETERVRVVKEWLELFNRFSLVVEDRPSTGDPSRADHGTAGRQGAGVGRELFLNFASESIGVAQAHLQSQTGGRRGVAGVRLAGQQGREYRLPLPLETLDVVNNARTGGT